MRRLAILILAGASLAAGRPGFVAPADAQTRLTADEAVQLALRNNYGLRLTEQSVEFARGGKKLALSAYLPNLSASAGLTHFHDSEIFFFSNAGARITKNIYSGGLSLRQNLVDWSSIKSIHAADRDVAASQADVAAARADLVLATKQQFYAVLKAERLAGVSDSALALSRDELQRVQSLFDLGMVARGDVLKAEVRVAESELTRISERGSIEVERARLARVLGRDPNERLELADDLSDVAVQVDSAAVFDEALRVRPDVVAAYEAWRSAEASLGAAKAARYPNLSGQLDYSYRDGEKPKNFRDFDQQATVQSSLALSIPIFDGRATKGRIQQNRALAEQARARYESRRLDVQVEVREVLSTVRQANERLLVARGALASAEEDLKLSQEKYNVGAGTILELIDAQVALQRARNAYVDAQADARVAEAQVARVRGVRY